MVVRHAHAVPRGDWEGDDQRRGLSRRGHRQALGLAALLAELKPARILSSPYARCLCTVRPLADALGLEVEADGRLAEAAGPRAYGLLESVAGEDVVLCSHGDVIPELLAEVAERHGVDLGAHPKVEKGSVWVLERDGDRFVSAEYVPPPG